MRDRAPIIGAMVFFWMILLATTGFAESTTNQTAQLIIEGKPVVSDVPPKLIEGRTFVPIRVVANNFNAEVDWNNQDRKVTVDTDSIKVSMSIGNKTAVVNGKEVAMDAPPIIDGGRALVPLRFVGESLGTTVGWEQETLSVIINQNCTVNFGGTTLSSDIYKLDGEIYIPFQKAAEVAGIAYPSSKDEQKITVQGKTVAIDKEGRSVWKLRKIGSGWYIPQRIAEQQLLSAKPQEPVNTPVDPNVTQLSSIRFDSNKVIINTTKPVTANSFTLTDPFRVVLDFPATILSDALKNPSNFQNGMGTVNLSADAKMFINQLRYSQYDPSTVRVVFELGQKSKYTINTTSNGIEMAFQALPAKNGFLVVLDAGHGGKDTGAIGITGNYEKDITLSVEQLVKAELLKYKDIQVVETRADDTYPTLQDRVDIAQNANADVFLSIHCNSFDPAANGTETYYYTPQSEAFANIVHKRLLAATGFADRHVRTSGFFVIKNTTMPSSLVELGFITNENEDKQLLTPEVQQRIAKSLADAIYEYYNSIK